MSTDHTPLDLDAIRADVAAVPVYAFDCLSIDLGRRLVSLLMDADADDATAIREADAASDLLIDLPAKMTALVDEVQRLRGELVSERRDNDAARGRALTLHAEMTRERAEQRDHARGLAVALEQEHGELARRIAEAREDLAEYAAHPEVHGIDQRTARWIRDELLDILGDDVEEGQ